MQIKKNFNPGTHIYCLSLVSSVKFGRKGQILRRASILEIYMKIIMGP